MYVYVYIYIYIYIYVYISLPYGPVPRPGGSPGPSCLRSIVSEWGGCLSQKRAGGFRNMPCLVALFEYIHSLPPEGVPPFHVSMCIALRCPASVGSASAVVREIRRRSAKTSVVLQQILGVGELGRESASRGRILVATLWNEAACVSERFSYIYIITCLAIWSHQLHTG